MELEPKGGRSTGRFSRIIDVDQVVRKIMQSGVPAGIEGGVAGGLLGNALMSRKGGKLGKKVLGYGAFAAVGGLAYVAWKNYRKNGEYAAASVPASADSALDAQLDREIDALSCVALTARRGHSGPASAGRLD